MDLGGGRLEDKVMTVTIDWEAAVAFETVAAERNVESVQKCVT